MGNKQDKSSKGAKQPNVTHTNVKTAVVVQKKPLELNETDYTFLTSQSGM